MNINKILSRRSMIGVVEKMQIVSFWSVLVAILFTSNPSQAIVCTTSFGRFHTFVHKSTPNFAFCVQKRTPVWKKSTTRDVGNPVTRVSNGCAELKVWYSREIDPCPPCRSAHRSRAVDGSWAVKSAPEQWVALLLWHSDSPTAYERWALLHGGQGSISPQVLT